MHNDSHQKVRYAVVGLGNIAQVAVLPAFKHARENSELAALISSDPEKLRVLAERYDVSATGSYEDFERVLDSAQIDAVYLATPNSLHRGLAERAAAKGVHVLCEKPLAPRVEDCEAMILAAKNAGVLLMTAYRLHFERTNLKAIESITEGVIGKPRFLSSIFSHQVRAGDIRTRADLGGGALFDMGVYCINAARYLFRAEPREVFAMQVRGTEARFANVDEMTSALLIFPGECLAQFTASQGAANVSEFRLVGSTGDIRLDPAFEYAGENVQYLTTAGETDKKVTPKHDQFAPELVYFSRCILEDTEPEPSGEEGLADVRIMQALVASAEQGRKIALPQSPPPERPNPEMAMDKPAIPKTKTVNAPSPSK